MNTLGTNRGSVELPFQGWRRFKEAFAPELVHRAIATSRRPVQHCVDPFGGSGTTALACQFLNVASSTIEVNPYLADLIAAKTSSYNCVDLASDLGAVIRIARSLDIDIDRSRNELPTTFIQPGRNGRWLFSEEVARRVLVLRAAIEELDHSGHRRLFRVLLGGVLVELSNVITSGKGRRYRRVERAVTVSSVDALFISAVQRAAGEIYAYRDRPNVPTNVANADARAAVETLGAADLAVFSPPYCNSFDYTDVYNVELWMLGYLKEAADNTRLRASTLCSHVQQSRLFPPPPNGSRTLDMALEQLQMMRKKLWDRRIPEMIGGYFSDMVIILEALKTKLRPHGSIWLVVADSRYANTDIRAAKILADLAPSIGLSVAQSETCRVIRNSPQQGGQFKLAENLLMLHSA